MPNTNNSPNHSQLNTLIDSIMSQLMTTEEASILWNVTPDHIKRLCSSGKVIARKRGKTWLILKNQPYPTNRE